MKKTIHLFAVGCMSAAMISGHVWAQDTKNQAGLASAPTANAHAVAAPSNGSFTNTAGVSTISLHAIKDFKGRFTNAKDEQWYSMKTGFLAYFTQDGFRERACYDKKGRWQYSLKYWNESKLPPDIRAVVKRTYYDFAITLVEIVEIPGHMVYLVHLDDEKNHKIVRVSEEGEMDVLEEFSKAN
jgi:hypothetical protein